ncbi:MAG: hypothetical protein PHE09_20235 [Oscillospiraceae bacterium]|nr:hypothetical protein [Oscillospiraceae bacterium]
MGTDNAELFGKSALYTSLRIDRSTVPKGFYCYDLRSSDYDPGKPVAIPKSGVRRLIGKLYFLGECLILADFCEEHELELPPDNRRFIPRRALSEEAGLFFALPKKQDAELGTIGHVRIDFSSGGKEFWHTWWPRGDDELNTKEFKAELAEVVNELHNSGPLKDLSAMYNYCGEHDGKIEGSWRQNYGYNVETERYRFCLRCSPDSP